MAMRVGTGNVAGVAVALYMGGPGALSSDHRWYDKLCSLLY